MAHRVRIPLPLRGQNHVPEAEIYTEEGPPIFPMASTKLRHLHGGSLGILDDIAKLDMPDYPMREVPFGEEGEGAAPPTPVGPKSRSVYITLDRVIKFSETPGCKACERKTRYHTAECRKRFARLVEEEKADLLAKRREGITVEEIPPPAPKIRLHQRQRTHRRSLQRTLVPHQQ